MRWKCWTSTGCLLTADGSDDHLVKPEGLPDYVVPPPSLCDPVSESPVQPPHSNDDAEEPNVNEEERVSDSTEFVAPEEDGNIF